MATGQYHIAPGNGRELLNVLADLSPKKHDGKEWSEALSRILVLSEPFTDGNRLQLLTTEMDKRVSEMLGSELLKLLPPIKNLQVTEHNCCEHMQQNCRKRLQEGTSRRSDPELRRFYKAALHRLGLAGDSERLISLLGSLQDDPTDEFLTDAEVLERLRIALPQAHGPMGWSKEAVASFFEQK